MHLISAFACDTRLALGQRRVDGKSNEITAVPEFLALLTLDGCIVTADAMHCQKATARTSLERGGDYVRAVKGNQRTFLEDIQLLLDDPHATPDGTAQTVDGDHVRIEMRRAAVLHDVAWLAEQHGVPGLQAVGPMPCRTGVEATREIDGKTTTASLYHVLSTPLAAARFLDVVRAHWHVENCLHWVLPGTSRVTWSWTRTSHAPARTMDPRTSPDCAASRSTSSAPTRTRAPREARSSAPLGTMRSSSNCSPQPKAIALGLLPVSIVVHRLGWYPAREVFGKRSVRETLSETPMNVVRAETSTALLSGIFLLDAHVHCYAGVPFPAFLDNAARNFAAGAAGHGCRPAVAWLLFTETAADHAFDALALSGEVGSWRIRPTAEAISLYAEGGADFPLVLVAGRQIVTREGLEVLAIGTRGPFADGRDLPATIAAVQAADGLVILPWGFGKWFGRRGRILAELLARATPGTLFLGDNAGRPALASPPPAFATARTKSIPVLPGSDPLPLAAEAAIAAGRYGFVLEAVVDAHRPAAGLKERLLALRTQPPSFGRRQSILPFAQRQLAMQWRKRRASR